jgi:hypothetical protein
MTLMTFLALSVLGMDFLLYALFQWTYGERHRKRIRPRTTQQRADTHYHVGQHIVRRHVVGHQVVQSISRIR